MKLLDDKFVGRSKLDHVWDIDPKDTDVWFAAIAVVQRKCVVEKKYYGVLDEKFVGNELKMPIEEDPKDELLLVEAEKAIPQDFKLRLIGVARTLVPRLENYNVRRASKFVPMVDLEISQTIEKITAEMEKVKEIYSATQIRCEQAERRVELHGQRVAVIEHQML